MASVVLAREQRVSWSRWFHCDTTFELSLVPAQAGVFAVAQELLVSSHTGDARRTLNLLQVGAADDLFRALSHVMAKEAVADAPEVRGRLFLRYGVVAEADLRAAAVAALNNWIHNDVTDYDSGFVHDFGRDMAEPFRSVLSDD